MIGFELSEEQKQLQDVARRFALNKIKPQAAETDNIRDPRDAFPKDIIRQGFELGFHSLLIPEAYGGIGGTTLDSAILLEELAAGDSPLLEGFEKRICMDVSDPDRIRGKDFPDDIRRILEQAMD